MLQLVYTSAPRLLEAGKTGFGTVARSRRIPQPLVAYLERISTFDRAAGVTELQFYSVFRMGKMLYHVFSRVADCGVDYTRRTNHIAHHWVMADDDAAAPGMSASTPAGVLLALRGLWLNTWQGNPAWLEDEPEVYPEVTSGTDVWQRITGQGDNARWLSAPEYAMGGYVTLPATCAAGEELRLLHESAMLRGNHGWGEGFTTASVETLSSKVCPLVCLSAAQQSAGVRPRSGVPLLQVQEGMVPPPPRRFSLLSSLSPIQHRQRPLHPFVRRCRQHCLLAVCR